MKSFPVFFFAFLSAFLIFMGITIVLAWTEPVSAPPADNVSAPVNVSGTTQYKSGALGVGGIFRGYNTAIFDGNVGIRTTDPKNALHIKGGLGMESVGTGGTWNLLVDSEGNLKINANTLEPGGDTRIFINDNTGEVGIGTVTPSQRLDVSGYVRGDTGLCIGNDCRTSWPSGGGVVFPIIVQPSGFSSLNADQTLGETNKGWISKKFFLTKHIANQLKFKIYFRADNDQTLNMRLCYGAAVTHETVPEYGLKTTSCGTEIKDIGGTWQSRNRQAKLFEGIATLPSPDNQYKYVVLQTSVTRSGGYAEEGSYYWGTLHYLIEE